jgi:hypothetical protein
MTDRLPNPARIGSIVMLPTNVQATVASVTGEGRYDAVEVVENTPERRRGTWRQGQLLVQRHAFVLPTAAPTATPDQIAAFHESGFIPGGF